MRRLLKREINKVIGKKYRIFREIDEYPVRSAFNHKYRFFDVPGNYCPVPVKFFGGRFPDKDLSVSVE